MFGRRKQATIGSTPITSLVSHDMAVQGDILFEGGLRIDGHVAGNVLGRESGRGLLVLSEKGTIAGRVKVHDAVINGTIEGDLEVEHFLELQAGARVTGNITYSQLRMDCGATVQGRLERRDAPQPGQKVVALITAPSPHRRTLPPVGAASAATPARPHPSPPPPPQAREAPGIIPRSKTSPTRDDARRLAGR